MSDQNHVVLIHGTWASGNAWCDLAPRFQNLGFTVHSPSLRYHDLPLEEGAARLGSVSLTDYVDDLVALVQSLGTKPLIVGHSLGGLIAQLVATKVAHTGLILLAPAPSPGMFVAHPPSAKIFTRYFLRWAFWRKAMLPPPWKVWVEGIVNQQPLEIQRQHFTQLCAESGRIYFEMVLWFLDMRRAAAVRHKEIAGPVLVFGATHDHAVHPEIGRQTAARYSQGRYIELEGSDHLMIAGRYAPIVMEHVRLWLEEQRWPNSSLGNG